MNNDINTLTKKVKDMSKKVDTMNYTMDNELRTQELRRIMRSGPKIGTQKADILDTLQALVRSVS